MCAQRTTLPGVPLRKLQYCLSEFYYHAAGTHDLKEQRCGTGTDKPLEMFWATGALSSFLDNTPTYLVFLTTAGTLGATSGIATTVGTVAVKMLMAISCGAVFMGANTYIGNAPNFMVKSISDENGIKMPSFFGYMLCSLKFLIPVFIIDTLVFFL